MHGLVRTYRSSFFSDSVELSMMVQLFLSGLQDKPRVSSRAFDGLAAIARRDFYVTQLLNASPEVVDTIINELLDSFKVQHSYTAVSYLLEGRIKLRCFAILTWSIAVSEKRGNVITCLIECRTDL